jgi:hypothetical protein
MFAVRLAPAANAPDLSIERDVERLSCHLDKAIEACLLNGLDTHNHSLAAAVVGLNETIALSLVKPLHSPAGHPDRPPAVIAANANSATGRSANP